MFSQPIVFVVGAGASSEFNMPTGADLKRKIASALDFRAGPGGAMIGQLSLHNLLVARFGSDVNKYVEGAVALSRIMDRFDSIDEALHWFSAKSEIVSLGKATIVREVLLAEQGSTLFDAAHPNIAREGDFNGTWLPGFLAMAINGLKQEDAATAFSKVTIIDFNYDRIIEHFLYSELQGKYGLDESEAIRVVSGLSIVRPYGTVGPLHWQEGSPVPFGYDLESDHGRLFELSNNVLTFTEQAISDKVRTAIRAAIGNSRMVVFLGFGFHQQNMQILTPGTASSDWRRVLATVMGVDEHNYETMGTLIMNTVATNRRPQLLDRRCENLFRTMRPTLMAAL